MLNASASIPQNIAAEINGSIPQEFKQRLYFGKLTWFATPDDTVNLIGYKRDQSNLSDFGGNAPPSHGRLLQTEQTRFQLQWRHSAGNFLNFLNIAHDKANQGTPNVTHGSGIYSDRHHCGPAGHQQPAGLLRWEQLRAVRH